MLSDFRIAGAKVIERWVKTLPTFLENSKKNNKSAIICPRGIQSRLHVIDYAIWRLHFEPFAPGEQESNKFLVRSQFYHKIRIAVAAAYLALTLMYGEIPQVIGFIVISPQHDFRHFPTTIIYTIEFTEIVGYFEFRVNLEFLRSHLQIVHPVERERIFLLIAKAH